METKKQKKKSVPELVPYMLEVVAQLSVDVKLPAVHTYTSTLHSFLKFMGGKGAPLLLTEVFTRGRLKEYEQWLMALSRKLPTVSTYMRTLRAVYNRWMPPGSREYDSTLFDDVYTKVEPQTKRALEQEEITELLDTDLGTLSQEQQLILAVFLLMFQLRGMPFIDLAHLRKTDVQNGRIVYRRHKTGKQIVVQIPKEAARLIREYASRDGTSIYLFPILNTEMGGEKLRYSHYCKALRSFNRSLAKLMRRLLPGTKVSSYTARHTWATLAYYNNMPVAYISQSLGHSSIRVTETYLKPLKDEVIDKENERLLRTIRKAKRKKVKEKSSVMHCVTQN